MPLIAFWRPMQPGQEVPVPFWDERLTMVKFLTTGRLVDDQREVFWEVDGRPHVLTVKDETAGELQGRDQRGHRAIRCDTRRMENAVAAAHGEHGGKRPTSQLPCFQPPRSLPRFTSKSTLKLRVETVGQVNSRGKIMYTGIDQP